VIRRKSSSISSSSALSQLKSGMRQISFEYHIINVNPKIPDFYLTTATNGHSFRSHSLHAKGSN
jgi:hypothetical protein